MSQIENTEKKASQVSKDQSSVSCALNTVCVYVCVGVKCVDTPAGASSPWVARPSPTRSSIAWSDSCEVRPTITCTDFFSLPFPDNTAERAITVLLCADRRTLEEI